MLTIKQGILALPQQRRSKCISGMNLITPSYIRWVDSLWQNLNLWYPCAPSVPLYAARVPRPIHNSAFSDVLQQSNWHISLSHVSPPTAIKQRVIEQVNYRQRAAGRNSWGVRTTPETITLMSRIVAITRPFMCYLAFIDPADGRVPRIGAIKTLQRP